MKLTEVFEKGSEMCDLKLTGYEGQGIRGGGCRFLKSEEISRSFHSLLSPNMDRLYG